MNFKLKCLNYDMQNFSKPSSFSILPNVFSKSNFVFMPISTELS
ncbi:hypothetical protein LEP1GSC065_3116 [Leptospira kirschneri serovar Sokoine str. RM1]|nr:hypothetical protein LEP1GSC176_2639 [Leptospira kirschneri str. MMD1493]EMN25814.1 hypothetical protein LEP1GSC065_3116 [Leptospira kirschneri serovar Sokoine str. RM1]EMO80888.1 hypothetical protein LEP1GSC126_3601 [Leptospira kirschneri str. 200801774]